MVTYHFPFDGVSKKRIELQSPAILDSLGPAPKSRTIFAAVHVVANPIEASASNLTATIDWETSAKFRNHLWSMGLGVAEAMDTAQRGMGLDWQNVKKLLTQTMNDAKACGGAVVSGVATDQLGPGLHSLKDITNAYIEQLDFTIGQGAIPVLMCSRDLAATAKSPEDYIYVYSKLLDHANSKVILHWLGPMFDPQLKGYWGGDDFISTQQTVLQLIESHQNKVDGIKMSLLDEKYEIEFREKLPSSVKMYTGDDFNYVRLIQGNEAGYSHALLGAFAAIGPFAAAAIRALDRGDIQGYQSLLAPTEKLSREIFKSPTYYYKTGIVWLAYLSGLQDHFTMVAGLQSGRSILDLCELFILANEIGLFPDPELALNRLRQHLALAGYRE